jgi:outer membrane protein
MIRPVCLRVLVYLPLAVIGLAGTIARAEQSEPAPSSKQADSKTTAAKPQTSSVRQNDSTTPSGTRATMTATLQQTPAEIKYGLPKTPVIGGPVDTDLSKPLTLERAVRIGLLRQNSIAIAVTDVTTSQARLTQARSSYYPQVTPTFQYQTNTAPGVRVGTNGAVQRGSFTSETRSELIAARQLIFDTGKREANVALNRRSVFASEYGLGNQRQNVILAVTQGYYTVLRNKELVRVQEESVRRAETTRDVIRAQVEVGFGAKSDTLQADADLANAQVALLQARNDYDLAQASLKNAMGVISSQPLALAEEKVPPPSATPDTTGVDRYTQLAYANRLDVRQQQERINAQGYSVRIAHINNGISLEANVTEGYALDPNAGEERDFIVSVTYPLFDGGNTRAAVRESKATLESERRTLDQLEQNVRLDVEQDYVTREQARQRVIATNTAVEAGQLNYNVVLEKQKTGLVNIPEVINAEVQLINAQVAQVQAIYDFYVANARLQRDIGVNDPVYLPKVPNARPPITTP